MATSKSLDQGYRRHRGRRVSGGGLGERLLGKTRDAAEALWVSIITRERVCFGLMLLFCTTVVAPTILTLGDRSMPFEYIRMLPREKFAPAGSVVHLDFTIDRVTDDTSGEFDRYFYDRKGKPTYYGTFPTIYHKLSNSSAPGDARQYTKTFILPDDAACGEGTYVSIPRFWHNPVQGLIWPIPGTPWRAAITVTGNCTP